MNRKAVLVGRNAAPSGCFKRLEQILTQLGYEHDTQIFWVDLFIGEGKPLTKSVEEITLAVSSANVVVLGMSSSLDLAQPEIATGEAAKKAGALWLLRRCS